MCGLAAAGKGGSRTEIQEHRLQSIAMRYMAVAPKEQGVERVLVAVHGVAREWREFPDPFADLCLATNTVLVIPRFSRSGYRGYQRLAVGSRGLSADAALLALLEDVAQRFDIAPIDRFRLFGYSGGAQFAHRFSLVHPRRVERQALAASGFYTMPDPDAAFPYGLGANGTVGALEPGGLTIPTAVFVGDGDVERDPQLRTGTALDRQQGSDRVERARRFVLAVRTLTASLGLPPSCSLEILGGCGHSFVNCVSRGDLARKVVDFLVPEAGRNRDRDPSLARPGRSIQSRGENS